MKTEKIEKRSTFTDELAQAMGALSGAELEKQIAEVNEPLDQIAVYATIEIDRLLESPTNPRKTFGDLTGLADSIKRAGLLQPIVVRRWPLEQATDATASYEIVAGHRRVRAAKIAGLSKIPVMIRTLTTEQVIELQLVENLRREGLNPIEEAEGFSALQGRGLSADQIAERIGTSKATVYARLKLLALCPEARAALLDGLLHPSVATPLARLSHRLQASALDAPALRPLEGQPAPARRAIEWLQTEYVRSLRGVPFDLGDETLCPEAGSCKACPKRTKNAPDLFDDLLKVGDACTDVSCYTDKLKANWNRTAEKAATAGVKVLSTKESAELYPFGSLADSRHVELDGLNYSDTRKRSWRELLEKVPAEEQPKVTLAVDREWKAHELVDRKAAVKALADAGVKWAAEEVRSKARDSAERAAVKAEKAETALLEQVNADLLVNVARGLEKAIDFSPGVRVFFEQLAAFVLSMGSPASFERVAGLEAGTLELDDKALAKAKPGTLLLALASGISYDLEADEAAQKRLAKAWGVDLRELERARKAAAEAEETKAKADKLFKRAK